MRVFCKVISKRIPWLYINCIRDEESLSCFICLLEFVWMTVTRTFGIFTAEILNARAQSLSMPIHEAEELFLEESSSRWIFQGFTKNMLFTQRDRTSLRISLKLAQIFVRVLHFYGADSNFPAHGVGINSRDMLIFVNVLLKVLPFVNIIATKKKPSTLSLFSSAG